VIHHLPPSLMWNMPIPVARSLAVAAKGLAVTCGQCPPDDQGQVRFPGDAGAASGKRRRWTGGRPGRSPGSTAPRSTAFPPGAKR